MFVSGDAYIDHPSFAAALLGRVLEHAGFRVAILPQPAWNTADAFRQFGRPRLCFAVSAGNMDSMINHYTAAAEAHRQTHRVPESLYCGDAAGADAGLVTSSCSLAHSLAQEHPWAREQVGGDSSGSRRDC